MRFYYWLLSEKLATFTITITIDFRSSLICGAIWSNLYVLIVMSSIATTQVSLIQPRVVLLSVKKTTTTITIKAVQDNLQCVFLVCNLIQTKLDVEDYLIFFCKQKTTSIFFLHRRRPQFFCKWKTTSIFLLIKVNLKRKKK